MNTRLTIDFKNPNYIKKLKFIATDQNLAIREVVLNALDAYFSSFLENAAVKKLAESSFEEWDNPLDSDYDQL